MYGTAQHSTGAVPPQTHTQQCRVEQDPAPGGTQHPGLYGHSQAPRHAAMSPCFILHLSWAVRSTGSVIAPVHPHLANSDPLFPGVLFLMELEIIWALLFLMCLQAGVTDRGSGVGLSSTCEPPATSTNVTTPQNHPVVKPCPQQLPHPQLTVWLFFLSKEKGPAGL